MVVLVEVENKSNVVIKKAVEFIKEVCNQVLVRSGIIRDSV